MFHKRSNLLLVFVSIIVLLLIGYLVLEDRMNKNISGTPIDEGGISIPRQVEFDNNLGICVGWDFDKINSKVLPLLKACMKDNKVTTQNIDAKSKCEQKVSEKYPNSSDYTQQTKFQKEQTLNTCYIDFALAKKDSSLCNEVSNNEYLSGLCFEAVEEINLFD